MCDYGRLTKDLFASLEDIKEGRRVYVVVRRSPTTNDIEIEAVIASESSSPQEALEVHCKAMGLETDNRLATPVLLLAGLNAEDAKGFRSVRYGSDLIIEFTQ